MVLIIIYAECVKNGLSFYIQCGLCNALRQSISLLLFSFIDEWNVPESLVLAKLLSVFYGVG